MANRKRIFGFVVYCDEGLFHIANVPKENSDGRSTRHGTLWLGNAATVFKSKRAAKRAIARTKKYRDGIDPTWWPWILNARVHSVGRTV